jgi:acylphosphatase
MKKRGAIIKVYGKVQGVGFRYYTHKKANELGLTGFVQNRPDGSVYIEAEGQEEKLDEFILWCHEGPGWARVTKVQVQHTPTWGYSQFEIR